ncbi:Acyl-CoA N-acyltransferases (NAT) superfamily protein [Euphorbia peplus]|nr:Acyl-CoA N-acyltransferases (NAT) superfamily protein [Euphorbia peplus]
MDPSKISLRPFKLSDANDFLKWSGDEQVARSVRWDAVKTKEEALKHLEKKVIPHPWNYSICLDDRSIGYVGVRRGTSKYEQHKANVGYAFGFDYWGQGMVVTALKMALSRVFEDLPDLIRLEAYILKENVRSPRVLEKVGFQREGLLRKMFCTKGQFNDFCIFSFLSTDQIL